MKELVRNGDVRRPTEMPRISMRYRVSGASLEWTPPRKGLLPSRRRAVTAEFIDLSVVGALVKAPTNDAVFIGMRIPIRVGNEDGLVELRNVRPSDVEGFSLYGVVFHQISPDLQRAVYEAIARLRNDARLKSEWDRNA